MNLENVQPPEERKKRCKKCGHVKFLREFHHQPMCRDGHKGSCIECDAKYNAARYDKKKPEILAKVKKWQAQNPEKSRSYKTKWRLKNIPPIRTKFQTPAQSENTKNTSSIPSHSMAA